MHKPQIVLSRSTLSMFLSFQLDVEIIVNNVLLLTSVNYMYAVLNQMKCKIKSYIQRLVCIIYYQYSNKLTQIIKKNHSRLNKLHRTSLFVCDALTRISTSMLANKNYGIRYFSQMTKDMSHFGHCIVCPSICQLFFYPCGIFKSFLSSTYSLSSDGPLNLLHLMLNIQKVDATNLSFIKINIYSFEKLPCLCELYVAYHYTDI